jgi:hypothetical protein
MTTNGHGILESVKAAPIALRLSLAAVWVGALGGITVSAWKSDWLFGGLYLAIMVQVTWIFSVSQRDVSLSGRERIAMGVVSIVILLLSIWIVMRLFVS